MGSTVRKIAINTGGGDAPGLNAVIRSVVICATNHGWECVGIRDGYNGLLEPDAFPRGGLVTLEREDVRGITHLGGTILGTTNRGSPLEYPVRQPDGSIRTIDRTDEVVSLLRQENVDALVAVGGDGSLAIANALARKGLPVVGVPKTIDNDLDQTVATFGFQTAVSFATECIDRLHSTAEAHERVMVVEVMGRYAGWIALHAGVAGTADVILIPEIPYTMDSVAAKIRSRFDTGHSFAIVIVAEGAKSKGGSLTVQEREVGRLERLGGVGEHVAREIEEITGHETRFVVLGHLLRGGSPNSYDRLVSLRFGAAAVRAIAEGKFGKMVSLDPPDVRYVDLELATRRMKTVPLAGDTVITARDLGISFGD